MPKSDSIRSSLKWTSRRSCFLEGETTYLSRNVHSPPKPARPISRFSNLPTSIFLNYPITPPKRSSQRRQSRREAYDQPRKGTRVTLILCVFHNSSHIWERTTIKFDPNRTNDRELWKDIRDAYRADLEKPWRRILGFRRVKSVVPCTFSRNGVPIEANVEAPACSVPKKPPGGNSGGNPRALVLMGCSPMALVLMGCSPRALVLMGRFTNTYHDPERLRPEREWVDWFVGFDRKSADEKGLEFKEGLWAEKLAILAILATIAIIVVSIVWCVLGGNLQTVFTVMSFVLTLIAAQIALAALYFQVATVSSSAIPNWILASRYLLK
ncbi:MAG: hypothetical protein FRX48_05724 [Lasallia pustulata]|uniref:Uncharacterized protein n=1 Tax=Lasallia pustulata TaxID=136370 RepID=A0A5M8PMV6_9LECA|nr:MAG: hypothetical protein FRX48_05724 [Lasallia pustulata]